MFTLVQFGPLDHRCGTTYDVVFDEQDEPYTVAQFIEDAQKVHNYETTMFQITSNGKWFEYLAYFRTRPDRSHRVYDKLRKCRVVRAGAYQLGDSMRFGIIIEEVKG